MTTPTPIPAAAVEADPAELEAATVVACMCITWDDFGKLDGSERQFLRRQLRQLYDHHIAPVAAERDRLAALPRLASPAADVAGATINLESYTRAIDQTLELGVPPNLTRELLPRLRQAITTLAADLAEARQHIAAFRDNLQVSRECGVALEAERDALAERLRGALAALNEIIALEGLSGASQFVRIARQASAEPDTEKAS